MMSTKEFKLRFSGGEMTPISVSLKRLGELIDSVEKVVKGYLEEEMAIFGEVDEDSSVETLISLVQITKESAGYAFAVSEQYVPAMKRFVASIHTQNYSDVPTRSYKALYQITKFAKSKGAVVDLSYEFDGESRSAVIDPSTELPEPTISELRGHTVLVGECIRVGGSREYGNQPKAHIRPLSSKRDSVVVTIPRDQEQLVAKFAARLYQNVRASGLATWRADTRKIIDFEARSVEPYEQSSLLTTFKKMAAISGDHWRETDAVDYVKKIREE